MLAPLTVTLFLLSAELESELEVTRRDSAESREKLRLLEVDLDAVKSSNEELSKKLGDKRKAKARWARCWLVEARDVCSARCRGKYFSPFRRDGAGWSGVSRNRKISHWLPPG